MPQFLPQRSSTNICITQTDVALSDHKRRLRVKTDERSNREKPAQALGFINRGSAHAHVGILLSLRSKYVTPCPITGSSHIVASLRLFIHTCITRRVRHIGEAWYVVVCLSASSSIKKPATPAFADNGGNRRGYFNGSRRHHASATREDRCRIIRKRHAITINP